MMDLLQWTLASFYCSAFEVIGLITTCHLWKLAEHHLQHHTMPMTVKTCDILVKTASCNKRQYLLLVSGVTGYICLWEEKCSVFSSANDSTIFKKTNPCTLNLSLQLKLKIMPKNIDNCLCCIEHAVLVEVIKAVFFYSCMTLLVCWSVLRINFCFPLLLY